MSEVATRLDLRPDHWAIVREILQRHVPDRQVVGFGSRATWTAKDYSDLDLAVMGEESLPLDVSSALVEAFSESDLPFKVDIVDWASTDETFRNIIRRDGVNVHIPAKGSDAANRLDQSSRPIQPPVEAALAEFFGTLDDKIALNRRMNRTLEAMARAIFKDWFVDFGPVRAKMEERDPYLSPEIWELYPDALDDEGKPVEWNQGTLADVAESPRRGVSPADVSEDTPYIGLEHMPRRSIALSEWERAGKVESNKTRFHRGDILFGKLRPYFHKVGFAPLDGICSTDIVVAIPRAQEWEAFALVCLSSDEFVDYTDRTSTGTKMPRTSWKMMAQYKVCLPPAHVAFAYQGVAGPLLERLGANVRETFVLAHIRDLLLPKLMSGEIRLREAEQAMEAVA